MSSWVWEKYKQNLIESNTSLAELLQDKTFCKKILNDKKYIYFTRRFYGKIPHSRQFKILEKNNQTNDELCQMDNNIATFNEYLFAKKYKELGFLTANHHPIVLDSLKPSAQENLGVICEDLLSEEFEFTTLEKFFQSRHTFFTYSNEIITETNKLQTIQHKQRHKSLPYFYYSFIDLLRYKNDYLQYLTQECYDKIIENILLSNFEFGDDEHILNAILCKRKGNNKFEELLVFDKESSAFAVDLSTNNLDTMKKYYTNEFNGFNYYSIHIFDYNETFKFRCQNLLEFIVSGRVNKKYWEFLNTIANCDYDNLTKQVQEETDLTPPAQHIDMLKYGSECAGKLYEMSK